MSKTNKFHFIFSLTKLFLAVWLLTVSVSGANAQCGSPAKRTKTPAAPVASEKTSQTVIDSTLADDPALDKLVAPYAVRVRALDAVIGRLSSELKKGGMGGGSLGDFVTDGMRAEAARKLGVPIDLVLTNSGGLRRDGIPPGELRSRDIFELLPFENALVEIELTGSQLRRALEVAVESREPQSGARIEYRTNAQKKNELVSAVLVNVAGVERPIDPNAVYRVITIDYLLSVVGGKFAVLQESRVKKPLGVTIRDAVIQYVKDETAAGRSIVGKLDGRFRREEGAEEQPK